MNASFKTIMAKRSATKHPHFHRVRATLVQLSVMLGAACSGADSSSVPAEIPPGAIVATSLGKSFSVRESAESWDALVRKTMPMLTWNQQYMMWARIDREGVMQFTLDRAHIYQSSGKPARWVLIGQKSAQPAEDDREIAAALQSPRLSVSTSEILPRTLDGGATEGGGYAFVKSTHARLGTVYELGWDEFARAGKDQGQFRKTLFILRDNSDKWYLVGEGPSVGTSKVGQECRRTTAARIVKWDEQNTTMPALVDITQIESRGYCGESSSQVPVLSVRTDYLLGGSPNSTMRMVSTRPYFVAEGLDTFASVVRAFGVWNPTFDPEPSSERLSALSAEISRLNPDLPRGGFAAGARVQLPTTDEVRALGSRVW